MTRVVSRLYTDYFPTDGAFEKFGAVQETVATNAAAKERSVSESPVISGDQPVNNIKKTTTQGIKSKRIFVARIPSRVSEEDLRKYFETYGAVEDAYRPRDFAKNTFRGIGFVTFVDPAAVDHVIAIKHTLGGAEVVVDRATPKDLCTGKTEPPMEHVRQNHPSDAAEETGGRNPSAEGLANNYPSSCLRGSFNEQTFDLNFLKYIPRTTATYSNSNGNNRGPPSNFSDDFSGDVASQTGFGAEMYDGNSVAVFGVNVKPNTPRADGKMVKHGGSPRVRNERGNKMITENFAHVRKVRGGPRIFVGKISKETVEQDLADYFSQFGFVMDVYIPRSRENKKEHRGFGFVTFETEASIKRAISQGTHSLKGAVLAIDVAVPESAPN